MKKIAIIGTGYVGLVTGACLAEMGNQVVCVDTDREKVDSLLMGNLPFFEPGLEELVKRGVCTKRLCFTDRYEDAIPGSDICFLCLPTPSNLDDSCDLSYVLLATKQLASTMDNHLVVVNKSTVPVGTSKIVRDTIQSALDARGVEIPFDVVSNPEFLREGTAIADCMQPDRILIGVENHKAEKIMKELYAPFSIDHDRILIMEIASAELAKYAANAMLASRLSLMNTFAELCEKAGGNINEVRVAIGADQRIGYDYLNPGIGFGGSCLPKDVKALLSTATKLGAPTSMLNSILEMNELSRKHFFEKIDSYFDSLSGKTMALWGLSFKPDTDDLREAPSLYLIEKLLAAGAKLQVFDPIAMPKAKLSLGSHEEILFCEDEYAAAGGADAIILATEWKQFQFADFEKIGPSMKQKVLFDGRNQYNALEMQRLDFDYFCVGQKTKQEMSCR